MQDRTVLFEQAGRSPGGKPFRPFTRAMKYYFRTLFCSSIKTCLRKVTRSSADVYSLELSHPDQRDANCDLHRPVLHSSVALDLHPPALPDKRSDTTHTVLSYAVASSITVSDKSEIGVGDVGTALPDVPGAGLRRCPSQHLNYHELNKIYTT